MRLRTRDALIASVSAAAHDLYLMPSRFSSTRQATWSSRFNAVGFPIEIIPEADPSQLKAGGLLPIRVAFRRKSIAGSQVEASRAAGGSSKTCRGRADRFEWSCDGRDSVGGPVAVAHHSDGAVFGTEGRRVGEFLGERNV